MSHDTYICLCTKCTHPHNKTTSEQHATPLTTPTHHLSPLPRTQHTPPLAAPTQPPSPPPHPNTCKPSIFFHIAPHHAHNTHHLSPLPHTSAQPPSQYMQILHLPSSTTPHTTPLPRTQQTPPPRTTTTSPYYLKKPRFYSWLLCFRPYIWSFNRSLLRLYCFLLLTVEITTGAKRTTNRSNRD